MYDEWLPAGLMWLGRRTHCVRVHLPVSFDRDEECKPGECVDYHENIGELGAWRSRKRPTCITYHGERLRWSG